MTWPTATLEELCEINVGRTPARANPAYWGMGEPWLSIADMSQGRAISKTKEQITAEGAAGCRQVTPGTVLLSFKLSIGKVARASIPLYTNEAIAALPIKRPDLIGEEFLMRALEQTDFGRGSNRAAMGLTLNKAKLKQAVIPLPPLDEQRRIATILDRADALCAKRRQVLAHLDSLTQSIFHDMFGDSTAGRAPIGDFAEVRTGSTPSRKDPDNYGGQIPWVKTGEVHGGVITDTTEKVSEKGVASAKLRLFPEGSVVVAMYGQGKTRGQSAILGVSATTNQACAVIAPTDAFVPAFLQTQLALAYEQLRGEAEGGNQPNLSLGRVAGFEVLLPSVAEQQRFGTRIRQVNAQQAAVRRALAADDELSATLQSRAFRGGL